MSRADPLAYARPQPEEAFVPGEHPPPGIDPASGVSRRNRKRLLAFAMILGSVVAIIAAYFGLVSIEAKRRPAPERPVVSAVVGLGYLDPASTILTLGASGSPDSARVAALEVVEGESVEAGQTIAILDNADKARAQIQQAEAQLALRRLQLARQRADLKANIASRKAALDRARADLASTRKEMERQDKLGERGYATPATLEKRERDLARSEADASEAEAALARVEATSELGPSSAQLPIDIAVAEQEVRATEADVAVARATLDQAIIRAPLGGRVLRIKTHPGERVGSDGIVEIGDVTDMQAVVEIYQTDIARIQVGQRVKVRSEAFSPPISGTIQRIGSAVRRQTVINNDPATATDARVIEVHVALDPARRADVAGLSRLQVHAVFAP